MNQNYQIKELADSVSSSKKSTLLSSVFKKALIKKFKNIEIGFIELIDKNDKYYFGKSSDKLKASITVNSQEFYVFLGSGGTLGVSESYMAGYWESDNLVALLQIVLKNRPVLESLDSGIAKLIQPINKKIHKNRQNTLKGSKDNILAHYDLSISFIKFCWISQ